MNDEDDDKQGDGNGEKEKQHEESFTFEHSGKVARFLWSVRCVITQNRTIICLTNPACLREASLTHIFKPDV